MTRIIFYSIAAASAACSYAKEYRKIAFHDNVRALVNLPIVFSVLLVRLLSSSVVIYYRWR